MSSDSLQDLVQEMTRAAHATAAGRRMHARMQAIRIGDESAGDAELIDRIKLHPELVEFFDKNAKTEVPIAGVVGGRFLSRRIDRMCVDDAARTVRVLDYKTDANPNVRREKYLAQVRDYMALVRDAFPGYAVAGYILWLHTWELEKVA